MISFGGQPGLFVSDFFEQPDLFVSFFRSFFLSSMGTVLISIIGNISRNGRMGPLRPLPDANANHTARSGGSPPPKSEVGTAICCSCS